MRTQMVYYLASLITTGLLLGMETANTTIWNHTGNHAHHEKIDHGSCDLRRCELDLPGQDLQPNVAEEHVNYRVKDCIRLEASLRPIVGWKIMDVTGKVLRRGGALRPKERINVPLTLPRGIYILETLFEGDRCVQRFSLS